MSAAAPQLATCNDTIRGEVLAGAVMWERMLDHVPTQLGKLISVASFRDRSSGEYRHANLDRILSPEVARRVLCESHEHLFAEWVGLFPDEQSVDVKRYLASMPQENARELLLKALESLIPPTASAVARHAFLSDLEAIFILAGIASPAASPRANSKVLKSVA